MATFMDVGILGEFSTVFIFLLVFTIIYAILEYKTPFGQGKKGLHAIIALSIAFLIIVYQPAISVINVMTPWFMVMFLFIFFVMFSVMMFGASEKQTLNLIKDPRVYPYIVIISIIIIIASFATTFGQGLLEQGQGLEEHNMTNGGDVMFPSDIDGGSTKTTSFSDNVLNTLVHPKVLGLIAILTIGMFTLIFLTKVA